MRRRTVGVALGALVACVLAVMVLGVTDVFGSGAVLTSQIGGWSSDGADGSTFWDSKVFDLPGASLTAVHCHGRVQYVVQLGSTGPGRSNPCYAAMGVYSTGASSEFEVYLMLPGDKVLYRVSEDNGPWRYCIGNLIAAPGPTEPLAAPMMPAIPC